MFQFNILILKSDAMYFFSDSELISCYLFTDQSRRFRFLIEYILPVAEQEFFLGGGEAISCIFYPRPGILHIKGIVCQEMRMLKLVTGNSIHLYIHWSKLVKM